MTDHTFFFRNISLLCLALKSPYGRNLLSKEKINRGFVLYYSMHIHIRPFLKRVGLSLIRDKIGLKRFIIQFVRLIPAFQKWYLHLSNCVWQLAHGVCGLHARLPWGNFAGKYLIYIHLNERGAAVELFARRCSLLYLSAFACALWIGCNFFDSFAQGLPGQTLCNPFVDLALCV